MWCIKTKTNVPNSNYKKLLFVHNLEKSQINPTAIKVSLVLITPKWAIVMSCFLERFRLYIFSFLEFVFSFDLKGSYSWILSYWTNVFRYPRRNSSSIFLPEHINCLYINYMYGKQANFLNTSHNKHVLKILIFISILPSTLKHIVISTYLPLLYRGLDYWALQPPQRHHCRGMSCNWRPLIYSGIIIWRTNIIVL